MLHCIACSDEYPILGISHHPVTCRLSVFHPNALEWSPVQHRCRLEVLGMENHVYFFVAPPWHCNCAEVNAAWRYFLINTNFLSEYVYK